MERQNTRIESEGAEFVVLGNLLIQGILPYNTYNHIPGYDFDPVNPCPIYKKNSYLGCLFQ
jgi:hypothetical protein